MKSQALSRIRLGLIAMALSGLLWTIGIPLRGPVAITDPEAMIQAASSPGFVPGWTIQLVGGVFHTFGTIGLYGYLVYWGRQSDRLHRLCLEDRGNCARVPADNLFFGQHASDRRSLPAGQSGRHRDRGRQCDLRARPDPVAHQWIAWPSRLGPVWDCHLAAPQTAQVVRRRLCVDSIPVRNTYSHRDRRPGGSSAPHQLERDCLESVAGIHGRGRRIGGARRWQWGPEPAGG